jgi:hypothetical protein
MPITNTKSVQKAEDIKSIFLFSFHPLGKAAKTGTAITNKKESNIRKNINA